MGKYECIIIDSGLWISWYLYTLHMLEDDRLVTWAQAPPSSSAFGRSSKGEGRSVAACIGLVFLWQLVRTAEGWRAVGTDVRSTWCWQRSSRLSAPAWLHPRTRHHNDIYPVISSVFRSGNSPSKHRQVVYRGLADINLTYPEKCKVNTTNFGWAIQLHVVKRTKMTSSNKTFVLSSTIQ